MAKDLSNQMWHGISRKEIPWYPTINPEKCIGCELCYLSCGREVFEISPDKFHKAIAERPYNCMVGCSTCATICPTEAISFPGRDLIWKVEREHKIFKIVHQEAKQKKAKLSAQQTRKQAEEMISKLSPRVAFEVAGEFGEKRFLMKLYDFVKNKDADVINISLENPTLKGTIGGKAPSLMRFEFVSEKFENIEAHLSSLHQLIEQNELVVISERKS